VTNLLNDVLFSSDLWEAALEKYAGTTHLTVRLFDADEHVVLGPVHRTPVFQLFEERGYDPGIFVECARRCLAQTDTRPAVLVSQFHGLAVVGTSLLLEGQIVGAAVGGYVFADFSQVSEIQRLARQAGIAFQRLWEVARTQPPVPQQRLMMYGELLQVLGDALLRENHRTRQYERAAAIIESSDDAIISVDLNGVITSWNGGAERLFGYTAQEAMSWPVTMLMPANRLDEETGILERIRQGESIEHYETVRRCKDGTLLDISLTVSAITDVHGRIVGVSKVARDITERKRAEGEIHRLLIVTQAHERELSERQEQLVQAGKLASLGELAAGIAHEINNPLNNIGFLTRNVLDRLQKHAGDHERSLMELHQSLQQVQKAAVIINHLRIFGRKAPERYAPVALHMVIRHAVELMVPQFRLEGIDFRMTLALEDPWVLGNAIQLEQVTINVLTNARDAVKESVEKVIHLTTAVQDGTFHMTIEDRGSGVPDAAKERIFDPFFTTKEVGQGTGLGLSITYSILQAHRGSIMLLDGPGAKFLVRLPLISQHRKADL
jgi:PAS domain S-box-containing protein